MLYLHEVLKPIISRVFDEKKYIELDPCKIDLNRTRYYGAQTPVALTGGSQLEGSTLLSQYSTPERKMPV